MISMKKETSKISSKNNLKIKAIYALLLISNIVFFIGLIYYHSNFSINFNLGTIQNIAAAVATICILGYVSGRLPKIKSLGESSVFGITYSLTICLIGLIISYFGQIIDISLYFGPYLDMFGILCAVLIFVILATNLKPFKEILDRKFTRINQLICFIIFALVGLFASYACVNINGAPANIRSLIVMISGLFGGPIVGIPVGIISAAYRLSLGGSTAIPSAISTIISGVIGSLIFIWNDKKFPKIIPATTLMFLFTGFEMLLIILLTPPNISFPFIQNIYPIMLFASVTGMLLFSIVIRGIREKLDGKPSEEEQRISELENELKEYGEKIEKLENEIEELKKDKDKN
jgi:two-component system LytT family sensor kinase